MTPRIKEQRESLGGPPPVYHVMGKVAEECSVNGVLKDIEYQQYTLTGNPTGFDMDDMN